MAAPGSLRFEDRAPAGPSRQAVHYAQLLARAYESGDRAKLNRYASEYPSTEQPLEVRRLAASVRVAARCLLDLLDGTIVVPGSEAVVVTVGADGPAVGSRPLDPPVPVCRPAAAVSGSRA